MATVRKRTWANGTREAYFWRYKDAGGTIRQFQRANKHVVEDFKRKTEMELLAGTHVAPSASTTVADASHRYLEHTSGRVARVTIETYESVTRNYIGPYLGATRLVNLTGPALQHWIDKLADDGCSASVMKKARLVLGQTLDFAARRGMVGQNTLRSCPPKMPKVYAEEMEIPTKEEIRLIFAKAIERGPRVRAIIHLAGLSGLRQGEIRGLTWSNVNLNDGTVHVKQALDKWNNVKRPKSKKGTRTVPVGHEVCRILREWKEQQPPNDTDYVFTTKYGTPMGPASVASLWMVHLYYCGLTHWPGPGEKPLIGEKAKYGQPNYRFHDLRHVAASLWIEQGILLKKLQVCIGHASVQLTLDRYCHLLDSRDNADAPILKATTQILLPSPVQISP